MAFRAEVAAVSARRRLALLDAFEESDSGDDIETWWHLVIYNARKHETFITMKANHHLRDNIFGSLFSKRQTGKSNQ